jgi:dihydropteroate synthase
MGVLNVTPDSFSDGGSLSGVDDAVRRGVELAAAGALILDVGGESTRPGAEPVAADLEAERVIPVVRRLVSETGALVSVDTTKVEVAREALREGAHLINDIGGLRDPAMRALCAEAGVPAVIMHKQGDPATMQLGPRYDDVVSEVTEFLRSAAGEAIAAGVADVLIDPGIGFGKGLEHNLALLGSLDELVALGHKLLVGASRKGFIAKIAGTSLPAERDAGSIAVHLHCAGQGASMVRVHDVAGHVQALRVWESLHG